MTPLTLEERRVLSAWITSCSFVRSLLRFMPPSKIDRIRLKHHGLSYAACIHTAFMLGVPRSEIFDLIGLDAVRARRIWLSLGDAICSEFDRIVEDVERRRRASVDTGTSRLVPASTIRVNPTPRRIRRKAHEAVHRPRHADPQAR